MQKEAGHWWCTVTPSTFWKRLIASPSPKTHDFWNSYREYMFRRRKTNQEYNEECMSTQKTCKEQHLALALVQCSQWWTDEHSLHWRSRDEFDIVFTHVFFSEDCWSAEFDSRKQIHDGNSSLERLVLREFMAEPWMDELLRFSIFFRKLS